MSGRAQKEAEISVGAESEASGAVQGGGDCGVRRRECVERLGVPVGVEGRSRRCSRREESGRPGEYRSERC